MKDRFRYVFNCLVRGDIYDIARVVSGGSESGGRSVE